MGMRARVILAMVGVAGFVAILLGWVALREPVTASSPGPVAPPGPADATPRLVVLSPGLAVILRDLGLADRIVGRHGYDMVVARTIPSCGDQSGLDFEAIIGTKPTHVLLQQDAKGVPDRLVDLATRSGWEVLVYPMLALDDIEHATDDLDRRFGGAASAHAELRRRWDGSMAPRAGASGAGRVLLLGAVNPPSALGPGSWHHEILRRIGGVPAITRGSPYMSLDAEDIRALAPDAIVLIMPRAMGAPSAAPGDPGALLGLLGRVGTLEVPAVQRRRVALLDDPLAHTPSTAMIGVAEDLARLLEAWSR